MPTNADAIAQAIFDSNYGTSSNATAQVGKLNPEQSDRFIDYTFDQTILTKVARVFRMNAPERRVPLIGIGRKPLRPATRGVDPGVTVKASPREVTLQTKEMIAEAFILDDELEDNVEGQDWRDHFMQILGRQVGNQLERAYLMSQSTNGTPVANDIEQMMDGWFFQATQNGGHTFDASTYADPDNGGDPIRTLTVAKLARLKKNLPIKYQTQAYALRFLVSANTFTDYVSLVGNRQTPFGDVAYRAAGYDQGTLPQNFQSILGWGNIPMFYVPELPETMFVATPSGLATTLDNGGDLAAGSTSVTLDDVTGLSVGDALRIGSGASAETVIITDIDGDEVTFSVPENQHQDGDGDLEGTLYLHADGSDAVQGTADGTFSMLTHFQNLIVGIQRDIRVEFWRDIRARGWYVVTTLRVDCTCENPDAMSVCTNLQIAA